jgi:hypothetical protein
MNECEEVSRKPGGGEIAGRQVGGTLSARTYIHSSRAFEGGKNTSWGGNKTFTPCRR